MAPASSTPSGKDIEALNSVIDTSVSLIRNLEDALRDVIDANGGGVGRTTIHEDKPDALASTPADRENKIDVFALARDSASLVKAHATKISLFIINEPFTPAVISKTLRDLVQGPIPALGSAVQLCHADLHTQVVRRDMAWRCSRVLKELKDLIEKIPKDGKVLPPEKRSGMNHAAMERGSITTTGLLWGVCDELIAFANMGVVGHLVKKAQQFEETLKDVMEELKEWAEESPDDDEDEDDDDDDDEGVGGPANGNGTSATSDLADQMANTHIAATQAMVDDLMDFHSAIPRDDPDKIRERLDSTLKRLRLTNLLYQAIIKRRLKILPKLPIPDGSDSTIVSRLDEMAPLLRRIPDRFNSLAMAFYELSTADIDRLMDLCFFDAFALSELFAKPWEGEKDTFTDWARKFQAEIKKN